MCRIRPAAGAFETIAQAPRPGHLHVRSPPAGAASLARPMAGAPDGGLISPEKARDLQNGSDRVGPASEAARPSVPEAAKVPIRQQTPSVRLTDGTFGTDPH